MLCATYCSRWSAPVITGVEVIELPWSLDRSILIQQFDVGVCLLIHLDSWQIAYKLIQYMACGIPVVASSVGANVDVVPLVLVYSRIHPSSGLMPSDS